VAAARFRRSPTLVLYWREGVFVLHDYATGVVLPASEPLVRVLAAFDDWRPIGDFARTLPARARTVGRGLVRRLHRARLLAREGEPPTDAEAAMAEWAPWNPAAGFFHAATRNPTIVDLDTVVADLEAKAAREPMPAAVTTKPGRKRVALPRGDGDAAALGAVLRQRRTWRQFGAAPITLASLATLLDLTVGVQQWVRAAGEGRVPFKTSPSGGARHPIEAYVAVRRVDGLGPGFYHYDAGAHALARLPGRGTPRFERLLPTQWWYGGASAVVLFAAVFARTRWRYPSPRAYRAVLIEAGHVCQTFCLTATALGLAPFCSMALADAEIDRVLGLDGVREAVLYAAGVGTRPADVSEWPGALPPRRPTRKANDHA
jgi:SagB-type dehydrogenase family enzyme